MEFTINAHFGKDDCAGQRIRQLGTYAPHCCFSVGDLELFIDHPEQLDDIAATATEAAAALREAIDRFEAEEQAEYEAGLIREAVERR